ncbi:hypothetical protein EMPG_12522 [Blastomyces silverae]|uniref:Uncharacterized protein n=1 Tax=Blastomyces silverae TaxID=2060906 RepID=A0A0H1BMA8_9EURO|nr:hypothetical protein EMPG_12522 [Blastomyces silverae]
MIHYSQVYRLPKGSTLTDINEAPFLMLQNLGHQSASGTIRMMKLNPNAILPETQMLHFMLRSNSSGHIGRPTNQPTNTWSLRHKLAAGNQTKLKLNFGPHNTSLFAVKVL